jgi:hypothetical protein
MNIAEPRELQLTPREEFELPASGQMIYKRRMEDHYGLMGVVKAGVRKAHWPRVGVRVPYEPMTFDDLKLDPKRKDKADNGDDATATTKKVTAEGSRTRMRTENRT